MQHNEVNSVFAQTDKIKNELEQLSKLYNGNNNLQEFGNQIINDTSSELQSIVNSSIDFSNTLSDINNNDEFLSNLITDFKKNSTKSRLTRC